MKKNVRWGVILLAFCGLAAAVTAVARWNYILAVCLIVLMNCTVMIRQRKYQKQLESLAFVDPVTGGRNLKRFLLDAEAAIREDPDGYMLVSMDVQDFKMINDVYGREEGDRTLAYIYRTIKSRLRNNELLARGNADVFYMLLMRQKEEDAGWRLRGLGGAINSYNEKRQDRYYLELRFGAYVPEPGETDVTGMEERFCALLPRRSWEYSGERMWWPDTAEMSM